MAPHLHFLRSKEKEGVSEITVFNIGSKTGPYKIKSGL